MKITQDILRATLLICTCCTLIDAAAVAQSSRDKKRDEDAPNAKVLELRLEKAEAALVEEYKDVAVEFYKQGDKEKSMAMLRRLKQLHPKLEGLGDRIKSISEELMQENADSVEIDLRKVAWQPIGNVAEGKAFRLKSTGEYKVTFSATIGVEGLTADEKQTDFVDSAPWGCLIGTIVSDGKPGKPFQVTAEMEHTPKKSGNLFLKVNVPEGCRCTGKLKVGFSGYIDAGKRRTP